MNISILTSKSLWSEEVSAKSTECLIRGCLDLLLSQRNGNVISSRLFINRYRFDFSSLPFEALCCLQLMATTFVIFLVTHIGPCHCGAAVNVCCLMFVLPGLSLLLTLFRFDMATSAVVAVVSERPCGRAKPFTRPFNNFLSPDPAIFNAVN